MTQKINVSLPDSTYRRIQRWAATRQQDVGDAIADYLAENPPDEEEILIPVYKQDPKVEREKAAFIKLHPQLIKQYFGKYVAIYNGQLVDHDVNYGDLIERIDAVYPDEFVWLTRVEKEPIGTIVLRSPRFIASDA